MLAVDLDAVVTEVEQLVVVVAGGLAFVGAGPVPFALLDQPARIDVLYQNLLNHQFNGIDLQKIPVWKDSPY